MARVKRKRKLKPHYIILVDGESEITYLNLLKKQSLEYWFYLHYKKSGNFNNTCKDVITQLKREDDFFKNYSKSSSDIEKLVTNLANKISIACDNAKNRECDLEQLVSCSQMNKIIEILN